MMSLGHDLSRRHAELCAQKKRMGASTRDAEGLTQRLQQNRSVSSRRRRATMAACAESSSVLTCPSSQELESLEHHRAQADEASRLKAEITMLKDRLVVCSREEASVGAGLVGQ